MKQAMMHLMALNDWSDNIIIAELADEPHFSEDMDLLRRRLEDAADNRTTPHVILNMHAVTRLNSSNIAQLLTTRKKLTLADRKLRICGVQDPVWLIFITTGLDAIFSFNEDVSTSLASLQISCQ